MNKENLKVNVNREKPFLLKRVVAYLIDMIFVSVLATAISLVFINNTNYGKQAEQLIKLTEKYANKEITVEEFSQQSEELNYYLTKESVGTTIVTFSVAIVYYVVLCYYCNGITLGKYLMKLRIVSANENKLNAGNYLLRALFANLILSNLISIVFVLSMNKDTFTSIYPKINNVLSLFLLVTMLFIMYRNDGRGLHDLIANTKVISTKEVKLNVEVTDANVIEEKQIEEKKTDKKTNKSKKKEAKK